MKKLIYCMFGLTMLGSSSLACSSQKFSEEYVIYEIINEKIFAYSKKQSILQRSYR